MPTLLNFRQDRCPDVFLGGVPKFSPCIASRALLKPSESLSKLKAGLSIFSMGQLSIGVDMLLKYKQPFYTKKLGKANMCGFMQVIGVVERKLGRAWTTLVHELRV